MIEGDLVKLKTKYPIWLFSFGLQSGDFGIITELGNKEACIYWLRIKRRAIVQRNLIEVVD